MKHIYMVHSIIPRFFTSAERAAAHVWANGAPIDKVNDTLSRKLFIRDIKRLMKWEGKYRGNGELCRITREELH